MGNKINLKCSQVKGMVLNKRIKENKGIEIIELQVTLLHEILNANTLMGIEIFIEMFTLLHPPAKLHYVCIVQHDVRWSARVQMLYVLPSFQSEINTFTFGILLT